MGLFSSKSADGAAKRPAAAAALPPASRNDEAVEAWMDRHMLCDCDDVCEITDPRPS